MRNGRGLPPPGGSPDDNLPPLLVDSRSPSLSASGGTRSRTSAPVTFFQATRQRQSHAPAEPEPFRQLVCVPGEQSVSAPVGHEASPTSLLLSKLIAPSSQALSPVDEQRRDGLLQDAGPEEHLQIQMQRANRLGLFPPQAKGETSDVLRGQSAAAFLQLNSLRRLTQNELMAGPSHGHEGTFGTSRGERSVHERPCGGAAGPAVESLPGPPGSGGFARLPLLGQASDDTGQYPQVAPEHVMAGREKTLREIFSPFSLVELDSAVLQTRWNVSLLLPDAFVSSRQALSSPQTRGSGCQRRETENCRRGSGSIGVKETRDGSVLPLQANELGSGASAGQGGSTVPTCSKASRSAQTGLGPRALDNAYSRTDTLQSGDSRGQLGDPVETRSDRASCDAPLASGQRGTPDTGDVGSSSGVSDLCVSGCPTDVLAMHGGCRRASSGASTIDTTPRSMDALSGLLCSLSLSPYSPSVAAGAGSHAHVGRRSTFDTSVDSVVSGALNEWCTLSSEDSQELSQEGVTDMLAARGSIPGRHPSAGTCCDGQSIRPFSDHVDVAFGCAPNMPVALSLPGVCGSEVHAGGLRGGTQSQSVGNRAQEQVRVADDPDDHGLQNVNVRESVPGLPSHCGWGDQHHSEDFGVGNGKRRNVEKNARSNELKKCEHDALNQSDMWERGPVVQLLPHAADALPESAPLCKGQTLSFSVPRQPMVQRVAGDLKGRLASERQAAGDFNAKDESTVYQELGDRSFMADEDVRGTVSVVRKGRACTPYSQLAATSSDGQRPSKGAGVNGTNLDFPTPEMVTDEQHDNSSLFSEIEAFRRTCCDSGASVSTCCSRREPGDNPMGNSMKGEQSDIGGCRLSTDNSHCSILFNGPDLFRASWDSP